MSLTKQNIKLNIQGVYMKLVKMSLAAALLVGANAFAIDNIKVSGNAALNYETYGQTGDQKADTFDQSSSNGQAALNLAITGDLAKGISFGTSLAVTDTLGLEQNLVGGTWAGPIAGAGLSYGAAPKAGDLNVSNGAGANQWWMSEAYIAATLGNTTAKVGRQYIDTPLAFSETWNIVSNSFAAAVLVNSDLPGTTLVGAYVGQSNGSWNTVANAGAGNSPFTAYTTYNKTIIGAKAVGGQGAYAAGAINNSWAPLTAQAWYYDVINVATATWLQADLNMDGVLAGAQYANMDPSSVLLGGAGKGLKNSEAAAVMVGYEVKDTVTLKAAYSQTSEVGALNIQNTATGGASKLYTEAWWNYGNVGLPGTTAVMVSADAPVMEGTDVFAQYNDMTIAPKGMDTDALHELTLGANTKVGPLAASVAYIYSDLDSADAKDAAKGKPGSMMAGTSYKENRFQVYLSLNF